MKMRRTATSLIAWCIFPTMVLLPLVAALAEGPAIEETPAQTPPAERSESGTVPIFVPGGHKNGTVPFSTAESSGEKSDSSAEKPAACELILEGKHIEKLVLESEHGETKTLVHPDARISLSPGRYEIREIELEGGYSAQRYPTTSLTLNPEEPCRPGIGAPLTPGVRAKRTGRLLALDYQLLDADGRKYSKIDSSNAPQFAVYQGDRQIGSGAFKYG